MATSEQQQKACEVAAMMVEEAKGLIEHARKRAAQDPSYAAALRAEACTLLKTATPMLAPVPVVYNNGGGRR